MRNRSKNPRRKKRKKNMSTGAKIAIAAGVVLVGVPLALFAIGAIGVAVVAKKGIDDMNNRPIPTPTPMQPGMDFYPAPM